MTTQAQINSAAKRSSAWIKARQKRHEKMILDSIKTLQDQILISSRQLSIDANGVISGPLQNWQKAQHLHQSILREFKGTFNAEAQTIINQFKEATADVTANFAEMGEIATFTDVNETMFKALRDGYYQDYLAVGNAAQQQITRAMYQHVIGGQSFTSLETSIRAALIGSAAKSAGGRPLAAYARLYAKDMIMNYHNDVMQTKAQDLKITHFTYIGTIMSRSRLFCRQRVGRTFSKKEIMSWTYKWAGKAGPALTYRGGYNCRHHWQPVRTDWLSEKQQSTIDIIRPVAEVQDKK